MAEERKLVGKIDDLPTIDCSDFIKGAEKRIVFGPGQYWDSHVMRNFKLSPHAKAPTNHHPWPHQALCIGGQGVFVIDGVEYEISEGSYMHVPSNAEHGFWNTSETEPLNIICIVPKEGDVNPLTATEEQKKFAFC